MNNHRLASFSSILLALVIGSPAHADDRNDGARTGFYGGVSLRELGADGVGLSIGSASSIWNRFVAPTADDTSSRALLFGGYRWRNDIAVEASFNATSPTATEQYALRPTAALGAPRGVGLSFGSAGTFGEPQHRSWNVDVFTSWTFYRSFALYGRLGYMQTDTVPAFTSTSLVAPDGRRLREGVNYGLGLRYDMSPALGLRLEYGRFGRFAGEIGNGLPETDQVTFGVQFRF
jgi:outer membrane protein with beta-barrel domain